VRNVAERIFRIIIGLLIIAIACTASYYFFELTPIHYISSEYFNNPTNTAELVMNAIVKMIAGAIGLALTIIFVGFLLSFAEYLGSCVREKEKN